MDILSWLEEWYSSNCDRSREHFYGVKIETLDNPGWSVKIDLTDTPFENRVFEEYEIGNGNDDRICCRVKDHIFYGAGDSHKLEKIIRKFKEYTD